MSLLALPSLAGWMVLWLGAAVQVEGTGDCPALEDVARHLGDLLPAPGGQDAGASDVARLSEHGELLSVSLFRADGVLIERRVLQRPSSCDEGAKAVAVVISSWESDVHPEFLQPAPNGLPSPPAPPAIVFESRPVATSRRAWRWELGVGVVGALAPEAQGADAAAGALAQAVVSKDAAPWGARIAVDATSERQLGLASGAVNWWRANAALGPALLLDPMEGAWRLEVHADAVASLLSMGGAGFTRNHAAATATFGAGGGIRVLRRGQWAPWLDLVAREWWTPQIVYELPTGATRTLPALEVLVALGVGWGG
jgi:hypothetical protein